MWSLGKPFDSATGELIGKLVALNFVRQKPIPKKKKAGAISQ